MARMEEEKVKKLKEAQEDATRYNKEIGDTYKKLMKQREELIEKVDIMKKLKPREAEETQEGEEKKRHEERESEKSEHRSEETKTKEAECTSFWQDLQKGPRKKAINKQAIEEEIRILEQELTMKELSLPTDSEGSECETGQMEEEELKKVPRQSARVQAQVYRFEAGQQQRKRQAKGKEPAKMAPMLIKGDGRPQ